MMKDSLESGSEPEVIDEKQITLFDFAKGSKLHKHRVAAEELEVALSEFGLSPNQSKIYIYLGKFDSKTAPEVSKALGLPRTETYHLLKTLQSRGLITAEISAPLRYSVVQIEKALTNLVNIEREKINVLAKHVRKVIELWNSVPTFFLETNEEEKEKMQVLQGGSSINNKIGSMIHDVKSEFFMFCTEKDIARFYHADFFEILDTTTSKAKFIICPAQKIPNFIEEPDKPMIRVLQGKEGDSTCFIIKDSDEALIFTKNASRPSDDVTAMWTNSKPLIESMQLLFHCCWEKAEIRY